MKSQQLKQLYTPSLTDIFFLTFNVGFSVLIYCAQIWKDDFKIFNGNYKSSIKKKISEALFISTLKPTLNVKEESIRLALYN